MSTTSIQYRVMVAKGDQRVAGPDDADTTVTIPAAVVANDGFDATVEYMRGRLKVTGSIGQLLDVLASGEATATLVSLLD